MKDNQQEYFILNKTERTRKKSAITLTYAKTYFLSKTKTGMLELYYNLNSLKQKF